jgi:hypothetical protein
MPYYSKKEYIFKRFQKSSNPKKKYDAILENVHTNREVKVSFGAMGYQHYGDLTGLRLYKDLEHHDEKRKAAYRIRHAGDIRDGYYSPGMFAWRYLWT